MRVGLIYFDQTASDLMTVLAAVEKGIIESGGESQIIKADSLKEIDVSGFEAFAIAIPVFEREMRNPFLFEEDSFSSKSFNFEGRKVLLISYSSSSIHQGPSWLDAWSRIIEREGGVISRRLELASTLNPIVINDAVAAGRELIRD